MITKEEFDCAINIVNTYKKQLESQLKEVETKTNEVIYFNNVEISKINKDANVFSIVSNRLKNCLRKYNQIDKEVEEFTLYTKVSELSKVSISNFLKIRNAGIFTLNELKQICIYAGIEMKP